jgi:hypothetical protein
VLAPICFLKLPKDFLRATEKCRNFCVALEYVLPVHRNPLKLILRTFLKKYIFTLTGAKMVNTIAHPRKLEVKQHLEVLI